VGPLISPPAGLVTATRADKFVCIVIIRRFPANFNHHLRWGRLRFAASGRLAGWAGGLWSGASVWQWFRRANFRLSTPYQQSKGTSGAGCRAAAQRPSGLFAPEALVVGNPPGIFPGEHLQDYLNEFAFRFNRRKSRSRGKLFSRLAQQAVAIETTTYQQIVGSAIERK
jgi:hypothetical protein